MNSLRNRRSKRALLATLAIGFLMLGPTALIAQEAADAPKTHTVKKGDTLWDLAALYLGDAFRWPELYRLNTDIVEDPHWIYPGEVLKLPGYVATAPGLADPTRVGVEVTPPTVVPVDTLATRPVEPAQPRGRTAFSRGTVPSPQTTLPTEPADTIPRAVQPVTRPKPTIRYGDFIRAPWLDRLKGPPVWGRILGSAELPGIAQAEQRARFQLNDRLLIAPPTGSVGAERELYLAYRNGPLLEEIGQIILPTGVVEVIRPPINGEAAIAKVVQMFREVNERDRLMPFDSSALSIVGQPTPIKNGLEGEIWWVADDPVLPAPTYVVVLSLSGTDGVKAGDEVELYQERLRAREEGEFATPEIKVGRAQVIKVTPHGSTAMITRLDQPRVEVGTKVRIVAKMQ